MAVTNSMYGPAVEKMFKGLIDLSSTDVKVALLSAYATHDEDYEDLTAVLAPAGNTEASGTGYDAGGKAISHGTADEVTYDGGITTFGENAVDTEWTSSTIDASHALVYYDGATKYALCIIDFDGTESSVDGTFKLDWNALGIFRADVSPA